MSYGIAHDMRGEQNIGFSLCTVHCKTSKDGELERERRILSIMCIFTNFFPFCRHFNLQHTVTVHWYCSLFKSFQISSYYIIIIHGTIWNMEFGIVIGSDRSLIFFLIFELEEITGSIY